MPKLPLLLLCLLAPACLAQKPHPCKSPPLLTGALVVSTQNEKLWVYANYMYDAIGRRIRLKEFGVSDNKTFSLEVLLLFREAAMYTIDTEKRKCTKQPLKADFQPMEIPKDAHLVGQAVLGSSSAPGQGLLVNTWQGELPNNTGSYIGTVTEFGCIPVSSAYHTSSGWMVTSFFNNVIGILDPDQLNPPDFCQQAEEPAADGGEPADFFSLFAKRHRGGPAARLPQPPGANFKK